MGSNIERWRRRQWAHDVRARRRNSAALDRLIAHHSGGNDGRQSLVILADLNDVLLLLHILNEPAAGPSADPYADMGLTLGMPERVAAGRALLETEPAA